MPCRLLLRFLCACVVSLVMASGAVRARELQPTGDAIEPAARLARHPQWLRLLHVRDGQRSEVLSPDFFLTAGGAADPEGELRATLAALASPPGDAPDGHARCRFPARALWLARQGLLELDPLPHVACPRLGRWARVERLRSVSLLLVSGYLGNPASSFGHALLRLDTEEGRPSDGLVDLGVNFGALVPDGESTLVYVARGLFGGYEAGFSDKPYHAHDLVYSRTEFRDLWEHELALDDTERQMLVYHLWEIAGKKFAYFFLKKNCAYRMAELLELAREEDLLERSALWFAPVEMFHRMHDAGQRRGRAWVRAVRFVPSAERVLRHRFALLDADQAQLARQWIEAGDAPPLPPLDSKRQASVLDALMGYHDHRAIVDPDTAPAARRAKGAVLRARLALAPGPRQEVAVPEKRSPAEAAPPLLGAVGAGHDARAGDFVRLRMAPFSYELSGHHGLDDGELVVLDTAVDLARGGRADLERLDLLRVAKLDAGRTPLVGDDRLSWQARLGARREATDDGRRLRWGGSVGAGQATHLGDAFTGYAMLQGVALGNPGSIGIEPRFGLLLHHGAWKARFEAGTRRESGIRAWRPRQDAELTRQLSKDAALRLELAHDRHTRAVLSLVRYW